MSSERKTIEVIQTQRSTDGDSDSRDDIEAGKPTLTDEELANRIREEYLSRQAEERLAANIDAPPSNNLSSLWRKNKQDRSPDKIATQPSVFDDPKLGPFFYPGDKYENRHRFDPSFRWTWGEELPLIRRIDWRIMVWACVAFFSLDLHRKNIGQANTDNFLDDLGMNTNDYNTGTTIFRFCFLVSELPSQLISKKLGP
jgi:MFS transporter, ACS family, DAL5 transporter family protein